MNTKIFTLAIVLLSAIACTQGQQLSNVKQVNSVETEKLIATNPSMVVLDVRTSDEFNQGHISNAINIDMNKPDLQSKIDQLDTSATYLVYCRTSRRSTIVVNYMVEKGFKNIYQMMDGFSGWSINGLPQAK